MSQKIFAMGFSVETVSVYLLCCSLADNQTPISTQSLGEIFTGSREVLGVSLSALCEAQVLTKIISDQEAKAIYRMNDPEQWLRPTELD
jgi:hypothetical protein